MAALRNHANNLGDVPPEPSMAPLNADFQEYQSNMRSFSESVARDPSPANAADMYEQLFL